MSLRLRTLLAFLVVYLVWGSTYFAVRLVVADVPPLVSLGARFVVAGLVLAAFGHLRGEATPTGRQWRSAAIIGVLLFVCGSGSIAWAQSNGLPSGTAALLVATVPLWMTLLGRGFGERTPTMAWGGLVLGFAGTALLVRPGSGGAPWLAAVVVLGAIGWALGSLLARRMALPRGGSMAAGAQMLTGGVVLIVVGVVRGELAMPATITAPAFLAWAYLVVFGSVLAFRAYAWLLQHVAPAKVGTYAYVNPVIAVALGGLAGESISAATGWAMALVLTGVACTVAARAATPRIAVPTDASSPPVLGKP
ncbi:MAG: EamA family transporter [Myxococcales bacterium]|nr:EamA family transporter [Myxococcales bacterium]